MKKLRRTISLSVLALTGLLFLTAWQSHDSKRFNKRCVNSIYHYELRHPANSLIYIPASGTHTPSVRATTSCDGKPDILILASQKERIPDQADVLALGAPELQGPSVAISVDTQEELAATIYAGATTLEAYFARNSALGPLENLPMVNLDGVAFVRHAGRLLGFHRQNLYAVVTTQESAATRTILSTLRFN